MSERSRRSIRFVASVNALRKIDRLYREQCLAAAVGILRRNTGKGTPEPSIFGR